MGQPRVCSTQIRLRELVQIKKPRTVRAKLSINDNSATYSIHPAQKQGGKGKTFKPTTFESLPFQEIAALLAFRGRSGQPLGRSWGLQKAKHFGQVAFRPKSTGAGVADQAVPHTTAQAGGAPA